MVPYLILKIQFLLFFTQATQLYTHIQLYIARSWSLVSTRHHGGVYVMYEECMSCIMYRPFSIIFFLLFLPVILLLLLLYFVVPYFEFFLPFTF